jgi:hypothetical protein
MPWSGSAIDEIIREGAGYDGTVADGRLQLAGAVQDLYDLYVRMSPGGAYRLGILSEPHEPSASWPPALGARIARIDALIRGASCMLANKLPEAALPVVDALWRSTRAFERGLAGSRWREPAYYRFLAHELASMDGADSASIWRLFGEVLAVYLDVLCRLRPEALSEYIPEISRLRGMIAQTGEISSGSVADAGGSAIESAAPESAGADSA